MKYPWLYEGAKVTTTACGNADGPNAGSVYTVRAIRDFGVRLFLSLEEFSEKRFFCVTAFRPLHDNSKTIEEMKQMMRDHIANASGGLGIRGKLIA